jgi:hypothetical protein
LLKHKMPIKLAVFKYIFCLHMSLQEFTGGCAYYICSD